MYSAEVAVGVGGGAGAATQPRNRTRAEESAKNRLVGIISLNVIDGRLNPLQEFVEPAHDVPQSFDAMPRLPRPRELVGLVGESHHHGLAVQILARAEPLLATHGRRSAHVRLALYQREGRRDRGYGCTP